MYRNSRFTHLALACAAIAGACSSANAQSLSQLRNTVPTAVSHSALVGQTPSTQILHLAIGLQLPSPTALQTFDDDVSNPASPNYRKFLTPAQVGAQFGPSLAKVDEVVKYLKLQGFTIKLIADSHLAILADATVAQAQAAFHTTINNYRSHVVNDPGRASFYSFATPLMAPKSIAPMILAVSGMQNHSQPVPQLKRLAHAKQSSTTSLTPPTTSVFYDVAPLRAAGYNGQGRTVAISGFGGFVLANIPIYVNAYGLPVPAAGAGTNFSVVHVDGGSQFDTPNAEADLDNEMAVNLAPLANIVVYDGVDSEADVLVQEANDNLADTVSESYGWSFEPSDSLVSHNIHLEMTAQGITYMNASGDTGANQQGYPYPDLDPECLVVGGTSVTFSSSGARNSETGWNGSGGGWMTQVDAFNTLPPYQFGTGVPTAYNFRLFPDVALDADPNTGEIFYVTAGVYGAGLPAGFYPVGGTSEASPLFAAGLADVEQYLIGEGFFTPTPAGKYRFGRINDLIYRQNGNPAYWYDVTSGSNGNLPNGVVSNAGIGWDTVTGWGALDFYKFATGLSSKPPTTVYGTPSIYDGQGTDAQGTGSILNGTNGEAYTETSIPNAALGAIAADTVTFQLTAAAKSFATLNLTYTSLAPTPVSSFLYLKNVTTGNYDLISTTAMTNSNVVSKLTIKPALYVSATNTVTMVVRDIYPQRLGGTAFKVKVSQASILEGY
jgi:subtilase family serine protease